MVGTSSMHELFPEIEPYAHGLLDVGDDQHIYWEECGNPHGKPAVVLHGGPGSGCTPWWRRFFDPSAYRVVLFDQRGCGRSTPLASDPAVDLSVNTTHHLLADIERLRAARGIERWLVLGASWGATLGLAYAEACPEHVSEIVLFSVTATRQRDVDWLTQDMRRIFPEQWERFRNGVPPAERDGRLVEAYNRLLNDPDPAVRDQAARDWCLWEDAHVATRPDYRPSPRFQDPVFRYGFARLVTHYFSHAAWLEDGILQREVGKLAGIPGVLIHGRLDFSSPLDVAWDLAQAWPSAQLVIIEDAGHGGSDAATVDAVISATNRFAAKG
jgi:proline iminopeptidase